MDDLTPEEVRELKKLLPLAPYAPEIKEQAKWRQSYRIVLKPARNFVLGAAAMVAALILLWQQFKNFLISIVAGS